MIRGSVSAMCGQCALVTLSGGVSLVHWIIGLHGAGMWVVCMHYSMAGRVRLNTLILPKLVPIQDSDITTD